MPERIILVLLGKRGAGKSSLAKMFVNKMGFTHIEMSEFLNGLKIEPQFKQLPLRKFVEHIHQMKGADYFVGELYSRHLKENATNTVITGVRHLAEINFLKEHLKDRKLIFIYLKVGLTKRLSRIIKREQRNSIQQFLIEEYYSEKWGDKKLKRNSQAFKQTGNIEDTFDALNKLISFN